MTTTFHFRGDLQELLRGRWKGSRSITLSMDRRASIKDVLESFGLPHTEVGSIDLDGQAIDFSHIVENENVFNVLPVLIPWDISRPSILRPEGLPAVSFVVDANVGRLARYLRAAGFDTLYEHWWRDEYLAELAHREKRILLTRDMRLLMRKQVIYGRYIRSIRPVDQLQEVVELFDLVGQLAPFTRCLECNSMLQPVAKGDVLHRLEPLTRKYFTSFSRCGVCDRIYWSGSHIDKMRNQFFDHFDS